MSRRSRALALLGAAAVCAGLAASIVNGYARDVRAQVGPLTPVIVARTPIPRSRLITPANVSRYLIARRVPVQFVPPRSLRFARDVLGLRSRLDIPAGSYLSESLLAGPSEHAPQLPGNGLGGMRVVEVAVAGAAAMEGALRAGVRVDVLITSERGRDAPRTYLALQRIELAGFRHGGPEDGAAGEPPRSMASLRVTLRQAVLLTAAENFASEIRLVPRPAGEDRRLPAAAVSAQDLQP